MSDLFDDVINFASQVSPGVMDLINLAGGAAPGLAAAFTARTHCFIVFEDQPAYAFHPEQ